MLIFLVYGDGQNGGGGESSHACDSTLVLSVCPHNKILYQAVSSLSQFLTSKTVWSQRAAPKINRPCPAWFTAPTGFSTKIDEGKGWTLEHNGTPALVFRCEGRNGVTDVLNYTREAIHKKCLLKWDKFLQRQEKAAIFYIKITTFATDRNPTWSIPLLQLRAEEKGITDFSKTYPVEAVQTPDCFCYLMACRGHRIHSGTTWTLQEFSGMFRQLWEETVAMCEEYHHGDIAKHNVLIDDGRLVLIDWDEARMHPKLRDSRDKYLDVLHPTLLRQTPMLYTKVQLALLFWRLKIEHVDGKADHEALLDEIPGFKEYAKAVEIDDELSIKKVANEFVSRAEEMLDPSRE